MRGAKCWTDLHFVRSILLLHIIPMRSKTVKSCRPAFDTAKLKQLESSRMYAKDLDDRLTAHGSLSDPHLNSGSSSRDSGDYRAKEESPSGLV